MSIQDRTERYSRIRAWLDYPYHQKPRPHQILNQMLVDEQWLNLRLTNEAESWNIIQKDLSATSGTNEYTIDQPVIGNQLAGKVYFAVRSTDESRVPYLPVPFTDYSDQEYGELPQSENATFSVIEQLSVYRTGMNDQQLKLVISPTPQQALTYRIWFYTGQMDRLEAAMAQSGLVSELSDFVDLKSTLALLPYCAWFDSDQRNDRKAAKIEKGLVFQYEKLEPEVVEYIDSINAPTSFSLGMWND